MRVCSRCVMNDKSDPTITFDAEGRCNYCTEALKGFGTIYFPNEEGGRRLKQLIGQVKRDGEGRNYDCIMGLSGGLDSSYLLYLGTQWNLRILAVHVDDGFDTDISKENLRRLVLKSGVDYRVIKPDEEQYNDLVKAYLKAGVPNIAAPQDNILFAFLYDTVRKERIRHFLSGGNFSLESILQQGNTHDAYDVVNLRDIHKKFGEKPINKLKFISQTRREIDSRFLNLHSDRPLNYIDYRRDKAFGELKDYCGFEYYGSKHLENILTAFTQLYWLPVKFGVDKRTSHLSSMIVSGQLSREQALIELEKPIYEESIMKSDIDLIKGRLRLTDEEFELIMKSRTHNHDEYRTDNLYKRIGRAYRLLKGKND